MFSRLSRLVFTFGLVWVPIGITSQACASEGGIDLNRLEDQLKSEGVVGWIHGSLPDRGLFVFTYRDPNDFFTNYQFPMIATSGNSNVQTALSHANRHDKVKVKGQFAAVPAPIKHIVVSAIETLVPGEELQPAYEHQVKIPDDLAGKNTLVARVHAVAAEGKVLVVEYGDAIIPVYVRDNTVSRDIYRGDKIRLHFTIRRHPNQPAHLAPNPQVTPNIEVLDRIVSHHGEKTSLSGALVLFKKSPQINRDIYALQVRDPEGVTLEYTLVNLEDPTIFEAILAKLQAAWQEHTDTAVNGRNKLVNPHLIVTAKGTLNVVSKEQANPQIFLTGPDDISLSYQP